MSEKLRSVNTKFWDDPWIQDLPPNDKLLFLYLLTNPLTNLLGVYEITIKRICFDTGLTDKSVLNGFERFGKDKKAFFLPNNYIILPNWLKNQHLNTNMKIAVSREFNALPKDIKDSILSNHSEGLGNGSEGLRIITECLGKYEREIEDEREDENDGEREDESIKGLNEVIEEFNKTTFSQIKKLTEARTSHIRARIKEYGLQAVLDVIQKAEKSDFMHGKNKNQWSATLDWIMNQQNFLKILEGNYDNKISEDSPLPARKDVTMADMGYVRLVPYKSYGR